MNPNTPRTNTEIQRQFMLGTQPLQLAEFCRSLELELTHLQSSHSYLRKQVQLRDDEMAKDLHMIEGLRAFVRPLVKAIQELDAAESSSASAQDRFGKMLEAQRRIDESLVALLAAHPEFKS